ncbi:MAG TPA: saccharopine dehydrogenase NADP-binding domain-containing protein [Solirubrobacteraceae bacterium]
MKLLILGSGRVGAAAAAIAARRDAFTEVICADIEGERARAAAEATDEDRFRAVAVDASDKAALVALLRAARIECVLNACDPRFNPPILRAVRAAGANYVDMRLGDPPFDAHREWRDAGQLALVGLGAEPGVTDVFARYARDQLFSAIDEVGVRVTGVRTTVAEVLKPPVIWERERGFVSAAPLSEPQTFDFPAGIGPVECVNVEHDEVVLVPRVVDCERVSFKHGLGADLIGELRERGGDAATATLPEPLARGGKACAGTYVTGTGQDGRPRRTYLHHVVDDEWSLREYGHQAVAWQTAVCAVVALELIADGTWTGAGVLGPEAFDAVPYLERLADYGAPHAVDER